MPRLSSVPPGLLLYLFLAFLATFVLSSFLPTPPTTYYTPTEATASPTRPTSISTDFSSCTCSRFFGLCTRGCCCDPSCQTVYIGENACLESEAYPSFSDSQFRGVPKSQVSLWCDGADPYDPSSKFTPSRFGGIATLSYPFCLRYESSWIFRSYSRYPEMESIALSTSESESAEDDMLILGPPSGDDAPSSRGIRLRNIQPENLRYGDKFWFSVGDSDLNSEMLVSFGVMGENTHNLDVFQERRAESREILTELRQPRSRLRIDSVESGGLAQQKVRDVHYTKDTLEEACHLRFNISRFLSLAEDQGSRMGVEVELVEIRTGLGMTDLPDTVTSANITTEVIVYNVTTSSYFVNLSLPEPTETCSNAVVRIVYSFQYSETGTLEKILLHPTYGTVYLEGSLEEGVTRQTFDIRFAPSENPLWTNSTVRSGNPGYVSLRPLLAGRRVAYYQQVEVTTAAGTENQLVTSYVVSQRRFGVEMYGGGRDCSDERIVTARFMEDLSTACRIRVRDVDHLRSLAEGPVPFVEDTFVIDVLGIWGNSDASDVDDWVEIEHSSPESTVSCDSGSGVVTECSIGAIVVLEVVVTRAGDVLSPQWKVIGARRTVKFKNFRMTNGGGSKDLYLEWHVRFIEHPAQEVSKQGIGTGIRLSRLPETIMYPFNI